MAKNSTHTETEATLVDDLEDAVIEAAPGWMPEARHEIQEDDDLDDLAYLGALLDLCGIDRDDVIVLADADGPYDYDLIRKKKVLETRADLALFAEFATEALGQRGYPSSQIAELSDTELCDAFREEFDDRNTGTTDDRGDT